MSYDAPENPADEIAKRYLAGQLPYSMTALSTAANVMFLAARGPDGTRTYFQFAGTASGSIREEISRIWEAGYSFGVTGYALRRLQGRRKQQQGHGHEVQVRNLKVREDSHGQTERSFGIEHERSARRE